MSTIASWHAAEGHKKETRAGAMTLMRLQTHWRRQGGLGGPVPPNCRAEKNFFVKIEGLLEPVVLNLSFRVRSNAMFTSERRYQCYRYQNIKNSLKLSALFSTKLVKILKLLQSPAHLMTHNN